MRLENFEPLFIALNTDGERRQRFTIEYNDVRVRVLFLANIEPFLLTFGIQGPNEYFELEMNRNFEISSFFAKELYRKLIDIFNIQYDPEHKFTPNDFLIFINNNVPEYKNTEKVESSDILQYKRDVEEADKVYFCVGFITLQKVMLNLLILKRHEFYWERQRIIGTAKEILVLNGLI